MSGVGGRSAWSVVVARSADDARCAVGVGSATSGSGTSIGGHAARAEHAVGVVRAPRVGRIDPPTTAIPPAIPQSTGRRSLLLALAAAPAATMAAVAADPSPPASRASDDASPQRLDRVASQAFRDWMTLLVHAQLERGPTPRWVHRDCAGLVRFAVAESLRDHDAAWRRANGLVGVRVPPDIDAGAAAGLRHAWRRADGSRGAYVGALDLVQRNARFVSRQLAQAAPADLLLYDFGDEQHLMVWMGSYVAYHTGRADAGDSGLRALRPAQLFGWNDTRWRPVADNPNFAGLHRFAFLA